MTRTSLRSRDSRTGSRSNQPRLQNLSRRGAYKVRKTVTRSTTDSQLKFFRGKTHNLFICILNVGLCLAGQGRPVSIFLDSFKSENLVFFFQVSSL
jgi:hypothetical protein